MSLLSEMGENWRQGEELGAQGGRGTGFQGCSVWLGFPRNTWDPLALLFKDNPPPGSTRERTHRAMRSRLRNDSLITHRNGRIG